MKMNKVIMGDDVVADVGFSNKGINSKVEKKDDDEYPYCLRLYLGPKELEMLGIEKLPELGAKMGLMGMVKVVALREGPEGNTLELQITDMDLVEQKQKKSNEEMFYAGE